MTRSDQIGTLIAALVKAQPNFKGAAKSSTNPHFKSKYADLAEIEDACLPALNKAGIAVLQPVRAEDTRVSVTTLLAHESGEWIAEDLTITAVQNTPQAIGSAITYGRRYGLAAMVGVAPEDDDGHAASRPDISVRPDPPRAVVDTRTGEEVPRDRAGDPPAGYFYINEYVYTAPWHEFIVKGFDAQGGAVKFSTKTKIGELAAQAYQNGVPVRIDDFTPKKGGRGEAYVNKLHVWTPEVNGSDHGEPLDPDSIPF